MGLDGLIRYTNAHSVSNVTVIDKTAWDNRCSGLRGSDGTRFDSCVVSNVQRGIVPQAADIFLRRKRRQSSDDCHDRGKDILAAD